MLITKKSIRTKDTYECAYYLLYGASIVSVDVRRVRENKTLKKGYRQEFFFTIKNVPEWAIHTFKTDMAYGNIGDYIQARKRVKRYLKGFMLK